MGKNAALYLRVSTTRQAEKDLSIPDQRRQVEEFCNRKGWAIVTEFVEPGASATSDQRPVFQRMIEEASSRERPFDLVVVHSLSRFFRDAYGFEHYRRRLERNGVQIVAITQDFGDDPGADMVRQILNVFDEYQSKENGKHVLRAMKENARQGFWNGSQPPYGYRTISVETRGTSLKKRLEIHSSEAEVVRFVFDLYLQGKGLRAASDELNTKGFRYRMGRKFSSSLVHQILTRTAYRGTHYFNKRDHKTRRLKDQSEWVAFDTPAIIEPTKFDRVQELLERRRPTTNAPSIVNGPTLLTGLAKCHRCGGGMTIRTGKSGRYRYYTCNNRASKGRSVCIGRSIPMRLLDDLIVHQLEQRIFKAERLETLLTELLQRNETKLDELLHQSKGLRRALRTTDTKIDRLMEALAEGLVEDTSGFKRKRSELEQQREELLRRLSTLDRRRDIPKSILSAKNLDRFAMAARQRLHDPNSRFRRQYVRQFVDRVVVGEDEIRIYGSKQALIGGILGTKAPSQSLVPSSVPEWWCRESGANPSLTSSLISREATGTSRKLALNSPSHSPQAAEFMPVFLRFP